VRAQNSVIYYAQQRFKCDLLSPAAVRKFSSSDPDENNAISRGRRGINYKIKLALALAIIAVGLAGRSALDKVITVRGGAELVALWAQVFSVIEMVSGVALAGVGAGLSVLAAQTSSAERQQIFLRRALRLGLMVCTPLALVTALADSGSQLPIALAALAGVITVIPGTVNSLWLGQQRRERMLALALFSAAIPLLAALFAPQRWLLQLITLACAVPALVVLVVPFRARAPERADDRALQRYILPGLVIGILSPASLLVARSVVGESLSWHDSGVLQALWRLSDWVCGFAAGILSVLYLPRMAAAYPDPGIRPSLREAARLVLVPCAGAFLLLFLLYVPVLEMLYDSSFRPSALAVALLLAGSLARIVAWLPLFGLYAAVRTRAIAVGEFLSLPLFAGLVFAARDNLTLELVAALWLATYLAYAAFNFWALRKVA
jgi:O-antigen/teichoic acid export membrane protein